MPSSTYSMALSAAMRLASVMLRGPGCVRMAVRMPTREFESGQRQQRLPLGRRDRQHREARTLADQGEVFPQCVGVGADRLQRDRRVQLAHEADVDQEPARFLARGLGIEVLRLLLELGRVGIGSAGDLGDAVHAGGVAVGVVEQHAVPHLHAIAHEVARLVVAHAGPGFGTDASKVVDREIRRFGLHQPVALAWTHAVSNVAGKTWCSVQTASMRTSHGWTSIASTCWAAKAAPTSQGGAARSRRNAKLRSYQPAPMPRRWQWPSNATSGATTSAMCSAAGNLPGAMSGSGMPYRSDTRAPPGCHGAKRSRSSCRTGRQ